jgi:ABC-type branched-subunit amino acid transport system ATPase component
VTELAAEGLCKRFGGVRAVEDFGLTLASGRVLALIGPNGAGKSTVINLLTGVLRPDRGRVEVGGRDVTGMAPSRIAELGVARTFQQARIFRNMTVLDNVAVGACRRARLPAWRAALRLPSAGAQERRLRARALEILGSLGLAHLAFEPSDTLTPGQDKLVELGRCLMMEPEVLLVDEPAAGLNEAETSDLASQLEAVNRSGISVLLVEHDMEMVASLAERVVVMDSGRQIAAGTMADVLADPRVIDVYLGVLGGPVGAGGAP